MHIDGDRVQDRIFESIVKKYEATILEEYKTSLGNSVNMEESIETDDVFNFEQSDQLE